MLQRACDQHQHDLRGVTFFYFTDNMTTYYTFMSGSSKSPSIHSLLEDIKLLEIELEIVLEVIHVPGTTIITEGTDGLSRFTSGLTAIFSLLRFSRLYPSPVMLETGQFSKPASTLVCTGSIEAGS